MRNQELKAVELERGASYLEFAFVLPFFLVFVMGIVEFGRGFNIYHNLTNACREGSRQAAMQDSNQITLTSADNVRNRVVSYMNSLGLQTSYLYRNGTKNPSTSTNLCLWQLPQWRLHAHKPGRDHSATGCERHSHWRRELLSGLESRTPLSLLVPYVQPGYPTVGAYLCL